MKRAIFTLALLALGMVSATAAIWDNPDNEVGDGWVEFDWFGPVYPHESGWAYSNEHSWFYTVGDDSISFWFYDETFGWMWTGREAYPFFFDVEEENWLVYKRGGTPGDRWFYNFGNASWQKEDNSLGYALREYEFETFSDQVDLEGAVGTFTFNGGNPGTWNFTGTTDIDGTPADYDLEGSFAYAVDGSGNVATIELMITQITVTADSQTASGTPEQLAFVTGEAVPSGFRSVLTFTGYGVGTYVDTFLYAGGPDIEDTGSFTFLVEE